MSKFDDLTERECAELIKHSLGDIKRGLRQIEKINQESGRALAANAAYMNRCKTGVLHAEMTVDLHKYWPEFAGPVQLGGGGGR